MTIGSHTAACFAPDFDVRGECIRLAIGIGLPALAHTAFTGGCATP